MDYSGKKDIILRLKALIDSSEFVELTLFKFCKLLKLKVDKASDTN